MYIKIIGKRFAFGLSVKSSIYEEIIITEETANAYEAKKSDPIDATCPTFTPTLSLI